MIFNYYLNLKLHFNLYLSHFTEPEEQFEAKYMYLSYRTTVVPGRKCGISSRFIFSEFREVAVMQATNIALLGSSHIC